MVNNVRNVLLFLVIILVIIPTLVLLVSVLCISFGCKVGLVSPTKYLLSDRTVIFHKGKGAKGTGGVTEDPENAGACTLQADVFLQYDRLEYLEHRLEQFIDCDHAHDCVKTDDLSKLLSKVRDLRAVVVTVCQNYDAIDLGEVYAFIKQTNALLVSAKVVVISATSNYIDEEKAQYDSDVSLGEKVKSTCKEYDGLCEVRQDQENTIAADLLVQCLIMWHTVDEIVYNKVARGETVSSGSSSLSSSLSGFNGVPEEQSKNSRNEEEEPEAQESFTLLQFSPEASHDSRVNGASGEGEGEDEGFGLFDSALSSSYVLVPRKTTQDDTVSVSSHRSS